jgi:uncharacterized damage-inducible protein DinB
VSLVDALLPEFDHEMTTTRKLLERLPEGQFDWKPHARSMSLGGLAMHVATIPHWGEMTLAQPEVDVGGMGRQEAAKTRAEVLAKFDQHVSATRAALSGTSDVELMSPWSLKNNGHTMFTMPKAVVWRSFVMNHVIHHRAQLSVYLRMHDVPVPAMYGPSADENT